MMDLCDAIHVVLVSPGESLNVGSVARLMSNLGFKNLHIVAAPRYDRARAEITACWGRSVLDNAQFHAELPAALAQMEDVVAFSAIEGRNRPPPVSLISWAQSFVSPEHAAHDLRRTALLFGPEDTGLLQEHLERARICVAIPASSDNPSFNLSNAVLLALYELTRGAQHLSIPARAGQEAHQSTRWATAAQHEQLDRMITTLAEQSGFYHKGTSEGVRSLVKNLTRRMQPDEREMQIVLGLCSQALKLIKRQGPDEQ